MPKDNFSGHAVDYAKYRPRYPDAMYRYLFSLLDQKEIAWDCATGNGQVAIKLAKTFKKVWATDLSKNQLSQAPKRPNIDYETYTAEDKLSSDKKFDLITVGQAVHWFDFDKFYENVEHSLKPNGVLALIGYSLLETDGKVNALIQKFYREIIHAYWDPERDYLDAHYRTIPFPFKEEVVPSFKMEVRWTAEDLLNYLNTWSAVKHYQAQHESNPVDLIKDEVINNWGGGDYKIFRFPLFLRVGKVI